MHKYLFSMLAILYIASCASSGYISRPIITEKDLGMMETNLEYSDASVVGVGTELFKNTISSQEFEQTIQMIDDVVLDEETKNLSIPHNILFETNSYKIKDSAIKPLSKLVEAFNKHTNAFLRVYGHTDNVGSSSYNKKLSESRASAVARILIELGVDESRIEILAEGEESPIASNDTKEGRSKNRRVEFKVVY